MDNNMQKTWEGHVHCTSTRHPVFFTEKLRRAPPTMAVPNSPPEGNGLGSPVAFGYVYQDAIRQMGQAPKL